jgi:hypothetical protein
MGWGRGSSTHVWVSFVSAVAVHAAPDQEAEGFGVGCGVAGGVWAAASRASLSSSVAEVGKGDGGVGNDPASIIGCVLDLPSLRSRS